MQIRRAESGDIPQLDRLLYQVNKVHSDKRPDLFKEGAKKYTDGELEALIKDDGKPIFVLMDGDRLLGYAFCVIKEAQGGSLTDIKSLYIDDLCVDENCRGMGAGTKLYDYVLAYAKKIGCYNVTLNVWECNPTAKKFYEKCGLKIQKYGMEKVL